MRIWLKHSSGCQTGWHTTFTRCQAGSDIKRSCLLVGWNGAPCIPRYVAAVYVVAVAAVCGAAVFVWKGVVVMCVGGVLMCKPCRSCIFISTPVCMYPYNPCTHLPTPNPYTHLPTPRTQDKFWRDNVDQFEERDFQMLRVLLKLLEASRDARTLAVGCSDLGQFVTYFPHGRQVCVELHCIVCVY